MPQELVKGEYPAGTPIILQVWPTRDANEEDNGDQKVVRPSYPVKKMGDWWLAAGDPTSCQLLVIKRVTVTKSLAARIEFTLPNGTHSGFVGADHHIGLDPIGVFEGEDSESDEDMDSNE